MSEHIKWRKFTASSPSFDEKCDFLFAPVVSRHGQKYNETWVLFSTYRFVAETKLGPIRYWRPAEKIPKMRNIIE